MKSASLTALVLAALVSFGVAMPTEKRAQFCYNYPNTIAGEYVNKKRELSTPKDSASTTNIAVRSTGDLAERYLWKPPTHIPWCYAGSTIWVYCVTLAQSLVGQGAHVVEELVLEALEASDAYIHAHNEHDLLPGTWSFVSSIDSRYTINIHGVTTYLVLNGALESILNYMQRFQYFAISTFNIFDHAADVAQATIRFHP